MTDLKYQYTPQSYYGVGATQALKMPMQTLHINQTNAIVPISLTQLQSNYQENGNHESMSFQIKYFDFPQQSFLTYDLPVTIKFTFAIWVLTDPPEPPAEGEEPVEYLPYMRTDGDVGDFNTGSAYIAITLPARLIATRAHFASLVREALLEQFILNDEMFALAFNQEGTNVDLLEDIRIFAKDFYDFVYDESVQKFAFIMRPFTQTTSLHNYSRAEVSNKVIVGYKIVTAVLLEGSYQVLERDAATGIVAASPRYLVPHVPEYSYKVARFLGLDFTRVNDYTEISDILNVPFDPQEYIRQKTYSGWCTYGIEEPNIFLQTNSITTASYKTLQYLYLFDMAERNGAVGEENTGERDLMYPFKKTLTRYLNNFSVENDGDDYVYVHTSAISTQWNCSKTPANKSSLIAVLPRNRGFNQAPQFANGIFQSDAYEIYDSLNSLRQMQLKLTDRNDNLLQFAAPFTLDIVLYFLG